jgi:hypothetical protein
MPSMTAQPFRRCLGLLAAILLAVTSGCTSVLSTASLRDLLTGSSDHAAESADLVADSEDLSAGDRAADLEDGSAAERRKAAIDEAVARLARLDHLDDHARATLVSTLQRTDQEDWPAVVDAFAESLATSVAAVATRDPEPDRESEPHVVAKADIDAAVKPAPAAESVPPADPDPTALTVAEPPDASEPETAGPAAELPPLDEPIPNAAPALALHNACFATRVQAWGIVDRFAADRFAPGQEVIVYFELDNVAAGESASGHTTCIDTTLRLIDADGSPVHEWGFEPIAETCRARRKDYFARYVVRVPAGAAAGRHAVELVVTDTLSGQVAKETLPLEIAPEPAAP